MKIHFTKMHGCGNDYIYFNCFEQEIPRPEDLAIRLSDRHFGIGGDGIVLIGPSKVADAKMRMFNLDGSEGNMCGNASRCVGKYLFENRIVPKKQMTLETRSGIKTLLLTLEGRSVKSVCVDMGPPQLTPKDIPVYLSGSAVVSFPLSAGDKTFYITCVSMGNPHCVIFLDKIDTLDLSTLGPLICENPLFPKQANTEFVRVDGPNALTMRVWERGSGETLACGTGACAAAVAAVLNGYCNKGEDISVKLKGGNLTIKYTEETVFMTGSAVKVFDGSIEVSK